MPEIVLDYDEIAEVTEVDSPEVQARLEKKGAVFAPAPPPADEGGAASITSGVVTVNQLDLSMPYDGFNNYENNCGPSCCAMVLMHVTGKRMYPDQIADWMRGEDHKGYTFVEDQTKFLSAHGVPSVTRQAGSLEEYQRILRDQVDNGRLAIVLVYFDWEDNTGGHFEVVYKVDEPGAEVGCINPWRGTSPDFTWRNLWENSKGGWVVCPTVGPKRKEDTDKESGGEQKGTLPRGLSEELVGKYDVQPESWGAYTKIDVNVRKGPSSDFKIVKQLPKGKHVKLTHYTDKGEKVEGSEPERRWHFSPGRGGWIFDGGLHRWKKI